MILDSVPCKAKPITIPEIPAADIIVFKVPSNFKIVIVKYNPNKITALDFALETKFLTDFCDILLPIDFSTKLLIDLERKYVIIKTNLAIAKFGRFNKSESFQSFNLFNILSKIEFFL